MKPIRPADARSAAKRAVAPRGGDSPKAAAREGSLVILPVNEGVGDAHGFDAGGAGDLAERPRVVRSRALYEQVGNDVAAALERGGAVVKRQPSHAAVAVCGAGVAAGGVAVAVPDRAERRRAARERGRLSVHRRRNRPSSARKRTSRTPPKPPRTRARARRGMLALHRVRGGVGFGMGMALAPYLVASCWFLNR